MRAASQDKLSSTAAPPDIANLWISSMFVRAGSQAASSRQIAAAPLTVNRQSGIVTSRRASSAKALKLENPATCTAATNWSIASVIFIA